MPSKWIAGLFSLAILVALVPSEAQSLDASGRTSAQATAPAAGGEQPSGILLLLVGTFLIGNILRRRAGSANR